MPVAVAVVALVFGALLIFSWRQSRAGGRWGSSPACSAPGTTAQERREQRRTGPPNEVIQPMPLVRPVSHRLHRTGSSPRPPRPPLVGQDLLSRVSA